MQDAAKFFAAMARFQESFTLHSRGAGVERFTVHQPPRYAVFGRFALTIVVARDAIIGILT